MKEKIRKIINIKVIIIAIVVIMGGIILELLMNAKAVMNDYSEDIDLSNAKLSGCEYKDGKIILGNTESIIEFDFNKAFVKKLSYTYDVKDKTVLVDAKIYAQIYNAFGKKESQYYEDNNPFTISKSTVNIREKADHLSIVFEGDYSGVEIGQINISNQFSFVKERLFFFWAILEIAAFLLCFRSVWIHKVENIFLVFSLTIGTLLVVIMPAIKVGWDEDVHFSRTYKLPITSEVKTTPFINGYCDGSPLSWPYNPPQSKEEVKELANVFSLKADVSNSEESHYESTRPNRFRYRIAPYFLQSMGIKFGQLCGMNFMYVYMLGRWMNLLTYTILIYIAIRTIRIGKRIMAVIALMPTSLFLAATYSYDIFVTGCIYIGLAYIINEITDRENKVKWKNIIIFLGTVSLGCLVKAVYIPIILLGLLLKKDKFNSKKQAIIYRVILGVCFLAIMSTFVLPAILPSSGSSGLSDSRGGNTDAAKQLSLIFSHVGGYFTLWLREVQNTFMSFTFGESVYGLLGHLHASTMMPIIYILVPFVILTDTYNRKKYSLNKKEKIVLFIILVSIVGFIWTALYMSFTEVGKFKIVGVQGRYYTPILFPFYLLLQTNKIKNRIKSHYYDLIVFSVVGLILFKTTYDCLLQPYWF